MSDTINYGNLMHNAMRGLMAELLQMIADDGLPGEHHFYITFDTTHPEVEMAAHLRERYPEDITIVIQHWFENLQILDDHFAITLSFGDTPEPLLVPFDAIKTFVDPSVDFGLRFENADIEPMIDDEDSESPMIEIDEETEQKNEKPRGDAEVVSLDSFRKP